MCISLLQSHTYAQRQSLSFAQNRHMHRWSQKGQKILRVSTGATEEVERGKGRAIYKGRNCKNKISTIQKRVLRERRKEGQDKEIRRKGGYKGLIEFHQAFRVVLGNSGLICPPRTRAVIDRPRRHGGVVFSPAMRIHLVSKALTRGYTAPPRDGWRTRRT